MLLTVDIGNTNMTLGVYDGDMLVFVSRMASDTRRMEDQHAIELMDILKIYEVDTKIHGAIISSVVPKLTMDISGAIKKIYGIEPIIVDYSTIKKLGGGLELMIENPQATGADLIVGYIAAKELYKPPCIVIDMGTASTVVVVDKNGKMLGGAIIPGVRVSFDALVSNAALLSSVMLEKPEHVIGSSTRECLQSGIIYGSACMIDGLCDRMEEELGYECSVVATGGLAETITKSCRREIQFNDTLLLDGLKYIYDRLS